VIFRSARRSEIRDVAELWLHTFPGDRPLAERMNVLETAGIHGGIETVLVAEQNGRIAGALKITPFRQYLGGVALPMMGLAAVGVAPWARRQGVGAQLCGQALVKAWERGDVVSVLYPFRPEFYRRLGWGLVGEMHGYRFAPEQLRDAGDPHVRLAEPGDLPGAMTCYARVARASNGMIERDDVLFKRLLETPATHLFVTDPETRGYLIVRYGRARSADRRVLHVRELVAEDDEAYTRLLSWISRQRDLWRRVRYDATTDEHFAHRLADPRPPGFLPARWLWAPVARVIRGPMLRVLNVEAVFRERVRWGPAPAQAFTLEVPDEQLPANRGPWRVEFDGTRARIAATRATSATRLVVDPPVLAQLHAGELNVSDAVRLGRATCTGAVAALDLLFQPDRPFRLLDEF
jgi:predicted acetyltransferase